MIHCTFFTKKETGNHEAKERERERALERERDIPLGSEAEISPIPQTAAMENTTIKVRLSTKI